MKQLTSETAKQNHSGPWALFVDGNEIIWHDKLANQGRI